MDRPATDASVPIHAARLRGRNSGRNPRGIVGYSLCCAVLHSRRTRSPTSVSLGSGGRINRGQPNLRSSPFHSVGGLGIAALGRRAANRDAEIGIVLAFMLGLGVLFLSLYTGYATEAYSILLQVDPWIKW